MNNYADITKKSVTESTKGGLQKQDQKSTRCDGSKLIDSRDVNH